MKRIDDSVIHRSLAVVWTLLAVPSVIWWKDSIVWVILISLYANVVGHLSAGEAAKGKEENRD